MRKAHFTATLASVGPTQLSLPVVQLTSPLVAANLGYKKSFHQAKQIQQALFRTMRRYLIVLNPRPVALVLAGGILTFSLCWHILNAPNNEVYNNPTTGEDIMDIGLRHFSNKPMQKKVF